MTTCQRITSTALTAAALLLSGCGSSRESALAEKLARAERAAQRAETAQKSAEQAAAAASARLDEIRNAENADTAPPEDMEREPPVDTAGAEIGPPDPA